MEILNKSAGDEKGKFTYIKGKGETVIYYVTEEEEVREKVKGKRSGRLGPPADYCACKRKEKKERNEGKKRIKRREDMGWSERIKRFKDEKEEVQVRREDIDGKLEELKERMEEIKDNIGKRRKKGGEERS